MSNPDARTVVPGQMVTYHNASPEGPSTPSRGMTDDALDELLQRVMAAADSGDADAVTKVLTPLVVASLTPHDLASVCGCLVGLLDSGPRHRRS